MKMLVVMLVVCGCFGGEAWGLGCDKNSSGESRRVVGFDVQYFIDCARAGEYSSEALDVALYAVNSGNPRTTILGLILCKLLFEQALGFKEVINAAVDLVGYDDKKMFAVGMSLFMELLIYGQGINEALQAVQVALKSRFPQNRARGLQLQAELIKLGYIDENTESLINGAIENNNNILSDGEFVELYRSLVKNNQGIDEAKNIASNAVKNSDLGVRTKGRYLFNELFDQAHGFEEAAKAIQTLLFTNSSPTSMANGIWLFKKLLTYPEALEYVEPLAIEAVRSRIIAIYKIGLEAYIALLHQNYEPENIEAIATVARDHEHAEVKALGQRILDILGE